MANKYHAIKTYIRGHDKRQGAARILAATGRDSAGKVVMVEVESFSDKPVELIKDVSEVTGIWDGFDMEEIPE